jgi:hypothetical protein
LILLGNQPQVRNQSFGASAGEIEKFVKLYSARLKGERQFMGSGVMVFCRSDPPCVYLLTAKHNLKILGKEYGLDLPDWTDAKAVSTLHRKFLETVRVRVGELDNARISNIFYFGTNWTYDVCCLTTNDERLYGLWRSPGSELAPLLWNTGPAADVNRRETLLGLFVQDARTQTLSPDSKSQLNNRYHFVQTGFGCNDYLQGPKTQDKVNQDSRGTLDYRNLTLTDYWDVGYDRDEPDDDDDAEPVTTEFGSMAAANASENATSAPGDSGGGVFALQKNPKGWVLAGVNLGANMHRDANNAIQTNAKAVNNVFTVLNQDVFYRSDMHTVLGGQIVTADQDEAFAKF